MHPVRAPQFSVASLTTRPNSSCLHFVRQKNRLLGDAMGPDWAKMPIKNVLLDINGVLFESGEDHPIRGSVEAMQRLLDNKFRFCLVTNECTTARRLLAKKLNNFGYHFITPEHIISPAPAACRYLLQQHLTPRLHIWDGVREDFEPVLKRDKDHNPPKKPNCLVVGDVMTKLSRDFIDESLEIMLECPKDELQIVSLGAGRYYKDSGRLRMDTGAYVAAFEYCLGVKATNLGKPSAAFFQDALRVVGGTTEDTIMIGDDIMSDVGGAQALGMRAFLVRTGKYKPADETDRGVRADDVFDDLEDAVEKITSASRL